MTGPILTEEVILRIRVLAADEAKRAFDDFRKKQSDQTQQSKQQVGEFQRLQQAVRTTTADFRAGIQTSEQYKQRMQQLRQEAVALRAQGIAPAGRELAAYSSIMVQTATRSDQAARVMTSARNAMATMAATALGASGRIGTLVGALLPLGVGGPAALALVLGTAAIAKGVQLIGDRAEEAQKKITALATANLQSVESGSPRAALAAKLFGQVDEKTGTRQEGLIEQQTAAEKRIAALRLQPSLEQRDLILAAQQNLQDINTRIAQVRAAMKTTPDAAKRFEEEMTVAAGLAAQMNDRIRGMVTRVSMDARQAQIALTVGTALPGIAREAQRTFGGTTGAVPAPRIRGATERIDRLNTERFEGIRSHTIATQQRTIDEANAARTAAASATASNALRSLALAALSGGNALQVLSAGASNLVQDLLTKSVGGPLAGLLGGLAGGLISKIFGGGKGSRNSIPVSVENVAPQVIDDFSKRIPEPQPVIVFSDQKNAAEAAVRIANQDHRDRGNRIPRSVVGSLG